MDKDLGKNISFDIFNANGTSFHGLVLHKATYDSVVMSLGDKIVGDAYYKDSSLNVTCKEYIVYNNVHFELVNPPTVVREGMASDNTDLHGMTKYSFEFYHPMYKLSNMPFTDIAVRSDQERFLSQNKTFSWIGTMEDYVAKLNANLKETEWVVRLSDSLYVEGEPTAEITTLGDVLSFDNNTIADALKTGFDTYGISFVIDKLDTTDEDYANGKRFLILFGLPSNEIIDKDDQGNDVVDELNNPIPFVFKFGQGVGLKNNSRNPKNNKIVTRIAGYGSTNNIPYGYPQIRWWGDQSWTNTKNDATDPLAYPIYEGIVGGEYVKLIKHPFTREHLMPSVYTESVFNKVSPYLERELPNGEITPNPNYNPQIEIIDYYDAIASEEYSYKNEINPLSPSYEIHEFGDIKPELGAARIVDATPLSDELEEIDTWEYTMDDNGEYHPSYFKIQLPILSFDIYACASITEEMHINMRGGACVGCTFPIQVDWEDYKANFYDSDGNFAPYGIQRDYTKYPDSRSTKIEVIVQKEFSTFGTLMPNQYQYPKGETSVGANDGDLFVILGISLPLSYITSAEERLDVAMKAYMLENNEHYFDYPLKFDEYFLRTHLYILEQVKPNTKVRFLYNDEELQLFVKQLTIKFGNTPLPQYDITLTDDIDVVLNQIGQVVENVGKISSIVSLLRQNFSEAGLSISQVRTLIDTYGSERFISRVRDDVANGVVTFLNGLWVKAKNLFGIDKDGNATLNDVDAKGVVGVGENPTDSLIDGSGTIIDDGRVQTTDMEVRGSLKVLDLIASQIHSLDGYYYFSDSMKIKRVVDNGDGTAKVYFEKEYDNDFMKFYQGDILLSATADLTGGHVDSAGGNVVKEVATQSWMLVNSTGSDSGGMFASVTALATDDDEQPILPSAGAYVARRGNAITDDESDNYRPARQNSWCISVEEGRIVYYINQTGKDINDYNIGLAIGKLPDIAPIRNAGLVGEIGVYAKYLLAQHIISVEYAGDVKYTTIDAGVWSRDIAVDQGTNGKEYFYSSEKIGSTTYITQTKVRHDIKDNRGNVIAECEWLCIANDTGADYTEAEPSILSTKWMLLSGGDTVTEQIIEYATSETDSIEDDTDGEGLGLGDDSIVWYADQSECVYDAINAYMWKRTTTKTVANPAGTQVIELIGVYGETGLNCHVTTDKDSFFVPTDANGTPVEELTEEIPIHMWLDETEIEISGWTEEGTSVPAVEVLNYSELYDEGIEVNTINIQTIEINIMSTAVLTPDSPKKVELRVRGKNTIGGKEYHYSRLHTVIVYGSLQGKDGESPLTINLGREQILVPTDEGKVTNNGSVVVNYASYKGSQQLVETTERAYVFIAASSFHGTSNSYLGSITFDNTQQTITIQYIGQASFGNSDWASVDIMFKFPDGSSMMKSISVYPNARGQMAEGLDAISVRMQPESVQFPVYDWKTVAMSNLSASPIAFKGESSVGVTLTGVSIAYKTSRTGVTVPAFLSASIAQDGGSVSLSVAAGKSINASTDYAELTFTYSIGGTSYSGLKLDVRPYLLEQPVLYTIETTGDIVLGQRGGLATITPNVLTISIKRQVGSNVEILSTNQQIQDYSDAEESGVYIYNSSGNIIGTSVLTASVGLSAYASRIDHVEIRFVSIEGITETKVIYVKRDGEPGKPLQTRLWVNVLTADQEYRNDSLATEATSSDGVLYVDYIVVEDSEKTSGYDVYEVNTSMTTAVTIETTEDLTTYKTADRKAHMESLNFKQVALNVSSAWFTTLFAKNANIRMMDGANIHMTNDNNEIVAGMSNASSDGYHFWSGAATGGNANFSVDTNGNLKAKNATLENATVSGKVTANMLYSPIIAVNGDYNIGTNYANGIFGRTYLLQRSSTAYTVTLPPVAEYAGLELQFFNDVHRFEINVEHYTIKTPDADNPDYIRLYNNRRSFEMPFGKMVVLKANTVYAGHGYWEVISGLDTHSVFMQYGNVAMAQIIDMNTSITQTQGIDLYKGTDIVVDGKTNSDKILYLPTSADVRKMFGLGSNDPFAYKIRITISYGSQGYTYIRFPSNDQTTNCKYFIGYNGSMAYDTNLRLMIGDVLEIMHVNDGTYVYAQILNLNT
jgi:hypothetical protein